jgi:uncharacterized protein
MPEYLSPGVYIEETSYRAKAIEGVATSTAGFVGQCRFGPFKGTPTLVTSFEEFQRYFGDFNDLFLDNVPQTNQLAHAVRLFFENGGARVYIARIFRSADGNLENVTATSGPLTTSAAQGHIQARFPGRAGNVVVTVQGIRSGNLRTTQPGGGSLSGVRPGDIIELSNGNPLSRIVRPSSITGAGDPLATDAGRIGSVSLDATGQPVITTATATLSLAQLEFTCAQRITLTITLGPNGDGSSTGLRTDTVQGLSAHPDSPQYVGRVLRTEDPAKGTEPPSDGSNRIWMNFPAAPTVAQELAAFAASILRSLIDMDQGKPFTLAGGTDGITATSEDFIGKGGDGEGSDRDVTGLVALGAVEDIAIVAAPGSGALDDGQAVRDALITHCERLKYRFAVLAADQNANTPQIREVRGKIDSEYAALYYPWLIMQSPFAPRDTLTLSPEGAVIGVYARTDIERGVWKAPANEVVNGILRFSQEISRGQQDVLNPEGINCLRFFVGRGYRVWGARTISSDIDWLYVNVRRLFIYLEHSIDRGTQWAVFEPNNEQLWLRIRLTIESFLYDTWRTGALMGSRPEQAYFVRCDRTTMTQSDLDNGRLICLIGVAPTKPAEFVIFRIGQWTAEASII